MRCLYDSINPPQQKMLFAFIAFLFFVSALYARLSSAEEMRKDEDSNPLFRIIQLFFLPASSSFESFFSGERRGGAESTALDNEMRKLSLMDLRERESCDGNHRQTRVSSVN